MTQYLRNLYGDSFGIGASISEADIRDEQDNEVQYCPMCDVCHAGPCGDLTEQVLMVREEGR